MSHDRDHDHKVPHVPPPREPMLHSTDGPDRKKPEHPTGTPREPVDPRPHPGRRLDARFGARPA
jgi:hypothetical protein